MPSGTPFYVHTSNSHTTADGQPLGSAYPDLASSNKDFSVWDRWFNKSYVEQVLERNAAKEAFDREQASAREAMTFASDEAKLAYDRQQASAREAMQFEADQAQIQRDWIDRQRSNAYKVQVEGLKAAGLNPMLAASLGGAPVVPGSSASGYAASSSAASGFAASSPKASTDVGAARLERQSQMQTLVNAAANIGATLILKGYLPKTVKFKGLGRIHNVNSRYWLG